MRSFLLFFLYLLVTLPEVNAQGENDNWMFRWGNGGISSSRAILNFNSGLPAIVHPIPSQYNATGFYSMPVSSPNGALRFSVEFSYSTNYADSNNKIRNASGYFIPHTDLNIGTDLQVITYGLFFPMVVPCPGNTDQYYIFYANQNGLMCSLLDMSLNGGTGGIIAGKKDIHLTPPGSIIPNVMASVKGCDGVWLVVRSRIANEYYSFHINLSGLDTNKVVSECGTLPINNFWSYNSSRLVASPNGKYLAVVSNWRGIELYDFEKCSGKVKNPRMIDNISSDNSFSFPDATYQYTKFISGCFSPDESKFYVTCNKAVDTMIQGPYGGFMPSWPFPGELFQYDLSQPTLPLVIASKATVLVNLPSIVPSLGGCIYRENDLGDIKLASNGKIYLDNGSTTCYMPGNVPIGTNPAGFHVINQPNLSGLTCLPAYNAVVLDNISTLAGDAINPNLGLSDGGCYLPPDIVIASSVPDTVPGNTLLASACFLDKLQLSADSLGSCYLWDDSSTERYRTISHSGIYYVRYYKNCNITTDTFHASLIPVPVLTQVNQSCPGMNMGKLVVSVDSNNSGQLHYVWRTMDSSILREHDGFMGDTLSGIDPGSYLLELSTSSGCDTTISATITALPKPEVSAFPTDTTIRYGDSLQLHAVGAILYAWSPSNSLDTPTKPNPISRPLQSTEFSVIGMNQYGCEDTAFAKVKIDYTMPDFIPNAFSPNGDGLNDVFKINDITYQKIIAFRVYNRFGQQIFSAFEGQQGWDGTQNGKTCDVGTYYYFIQLDYPDGKRKTYKGDITLLR